MRCQCTSRSHVRRKPFQLLDQVEVLKLAAYPRELVPGELSRSVLAEVFPGSSIAIVSRHRTFGSWRTQTPVSKHFSTPGLFFALNFEPRQTRRPIPLSRNNLRGAWPSVPSLLPQTETRRSGPLGTSRSLRSRFVSRKQRHARLGSCPPLASLSSFRISKSHFGVMRPWGNRHVTKATTSFWIVDWMSE